MSPLARPHPTTEGRRGSRIDLEERGRYLISPEIALSERSRVSRELGAVQAHRATWVAPDLIARRIDRMRVMRSSERARCL
jgi:hypothetical protein